MADEPLESNGGGETDQEAARRVLRARIPRHAAERQRDQKTSRIALSLAIVAILGIAAAALTIGRFNAAPGPPTLAAAETCGGIISGSWAIATRLAPEVAQNFLRQRGFTPTRYEADANGDIVIEGARGAERCAIIVRPSTSAQGFADLANGSSLLTVSQRPVTQREIEMLASAGAGDFSAERDLAEHVIGFDAYGIVVNAANPIQHVRYDLVPAVVMGRITNWSMLGGPDAPINLYSIRGGSGPEDFPNDLVPHYNQAWIDAFARMRILHDEDEAVAAIAADRNAFALMSTAYVADSSNVRALAMTFRGPPREPTPANVLNETYPAARRLFVYTRPLSARSNPFVRDLVAYFKSPEAFATIEVAGFAPLHPTSRLSSVASSLSGCRFGTAEYAALTSATNNADRLPVTLHFAPGTLELDSDARAYVAAKAETFQRRLVANEHITLIGHTDYTGDVTMNRTLALRRANAVRAAFESFGVVGLEIESAGEVCPISTNQTQEGRERNRRVEIWVRARSLPPS